MSDPAFSPTGRRSTRRRFLRTAALGAGLGALGPAFLAPGRAAAATTTLVFAGRGGAVQEAQARVFLEPFARETGVRIAEADGSDPARIKAMAAAKSMDWDLVALTGVEADALARDGLLEPIPDWVCDRADLVHAPWWRETALAWHYGLSGIAFDPARHPKDARPATWADFWNAARFPGRRGLAAEAVNNLERALLADGAAPGALYPLDVDRAFKALDRLKPHLALWLKTDAQAVGVIQTGAADFNPACAARVTEAAAFGASIAVSLGQPLAVPGYLAVPRGSRNKDAAFRLMAHWMKPEMQARWAAARPGSVPRSKAALRLLPEALKRQLPGEADGHVLFVDVGWWSQNGAPAQRRFHDWMLG